MNQQTINQPDEINSQLSFDGNIFINLNASSLRVLFEKDRNFYDNLKQDAKKELLNITKSSIAKNIQNQLQDLIVKETSKQSAKYFTKKSGYYEPVSLTSTYQKQLDDEIDSAFSRLIKETIDSYCNSEKFKEQLISKIQSNMLSYAISQLNDEIKKEALKLTI